MTVVDPWVAAWRRGPACVALLWMLASVRVLGSEGLPPTRTVSPLERLAPARLKAAHDDAERIRSTRHALPPLPGLNDYRAILHAHAEDSAHTGGTRPEMLAEAKNAGVNAILLTDHYRPPQRLHHRRAGAACTTACSSCPGRRSAGSCSIPPARSWTG